MRNISIIFALSLLTGCLSAQKNLSPDQHLFVTHAEYNIWMDKIADVSEVIMASPDVSLEYKEKTMEIIKDIANKNEQVIVLLKETYKTKQEVESIVLLLKQRIAEYDQMYRNLISYRENKQ